MRTAAAGADRRLIGWAGVLALATGLFLFLAPAHGDPVLAVDAHPADRPGAGRGLLPRRSPGVGALVDRRWTSARLPFQVAARDAGAHRWSPARGRRAQFDAGERAHLAVRWSDSRTSPWRSAAVYAGWSGRVPDDVRQHRRRCSTRMRADLAELTPAATRGGSSTPPTCAPPRRSPTRSTAAGSPTRTGSAAGTSPSPSSTSTRSTPTGAGDAVSGPWRVAFDAARRPARTCHRCGTCCSGSTRTSTTTCRRRCSR